jgi:Holliday junction resolvase RusA-like endonuclease
MSEPFIVVTMPGEVKGKGRHRSRMAFNKATGAQFIMQHPDKKTAEYEGDLKTFARQEMKENGLGMLDEPVSMLVEVERAIPKSWSQKKQALARSGQIMPTGKPDWDNYAKTVGDAFNGLVFRDDSLVVMGQCVKRYGDTPMLRVTIWCWNAPQGVAEPRPEPAAAVELFPEG